MNGHQRAHLRPRTAVGVGLAALGIAATGCSGSRSYSRFTSDACAATLPVAQAAVHGPGRLVAIRPFQRAELKRYFGITPRPAPGGNPPPANPAPTTQPRACLVVFRGVFAAESVAGAGQQAGRYALVLVRVRAPQVLRTRVTGSFPPAA